ncbi:hypothetical protein RX331_28295 [Bradyrhizobium sp. BWA-3-5]|nr:hypothetical protein [Bradyrhizobium sp. BWA-3-5]WOH64419.1 hypothetical protein RX331_28295 [Bradyrhizobium sp. BWA-3-5]
MIAQVDAASLPDEPAAPFQCGKRRRNAGTSYAQDDRQHVVRHRNDPVVEPVRCKQQPAAQPFFEAVAGAAKSCLGVLHQERMDIVEQLLLDIGASMRDPSQVGHCDAQCIAGDRHQASIGRSDYAKHGRHADEAQPSNHGDFNRPVALRPHQHRCDAALDEIDVFDGMVMVLKNRPALEGNGLQERTKSLKGSRRKSGQQAVLDPNRRLAVGAA